jgi:uncharacterized protein (DUF1330 family)
MGGHCTASLLSSSLVQGAPSGLTGAGERGQHGCPPAALRALMVAGYLDTLGLHDRRYRETWRMFLMPAYLIAEHIITNQPKFDEYRTKAAPMMAKHGGRYLTKGGSHILPEGGHWKPERVVIIEFPDMSSLNAWYTSPEYQPLIALRKECTSDLDMLFTLEGV